MSNCVMVRMQVYSGKLLVDSNFNRDTFSHFLFGDDVSGATVGWHSRVLQSFLDRI